VQVAAAVAVAKQKNLDLNGFVDPGAGPVVVHRVLRGRGGDLRFARQFVAFLFQLGFQLQQRTGFGAADICSLQNRTDFIRENDTGSRQPHLLRPAEHIAFIRQILIAAMKQIALGIVNLAVQQCHPPNRSRRTRQFPSVPPQPTDPLQDHVARCQPGEQVIAVDVNRLFQKLGSHENASAPDTLRLAVLPVNSHPTRFSLFAFAPRIAGVQQPQFHRLRSVGVELPENPLRVVHGVLDPQHLLTGNGPADRVGHAGVFVGGVANRDFPRRVSGERQLFHRGFRRSHRHQRIGRRRRPTHLQQLLAGGAGQRRAEDDHGRPPIAQPRRQLPDQLTGVIIIGMHFVDHHQLPRQPEGAQIAVPDVDDREQRLIDGADREGSQQRPFGGVEPGIRFAMCPAVSPLFVKIPVEPGVAVNQQRFARRTGGQNFFQERIDAVADLFGSQLGGQRKINSVDLPLAQQPITEV